MIFIFFMIPCQYSFEQIYMKKQFILTSLHSLSVQSQYLLIVFLQNNYLKMSQVPSPLTTFIQSLIAPGKMTQSIQSAQHEPQNNQYHSNDVGKGLHKLNPNIIKTQSLQETDQPTLSTNITKTIIARYHTSCQQEDKLRQQQEYKKKKLKQMQIQRQRLNSLRKQYENIRNIQAKQSNQNYSYNIITPPKDKNRSPQSYKQSSSKSEIYIKNTHSTSKNKQRDRDRDRDRDYRLLEYQKKQLEITLSRNMEKLQQMIRNQIQYKRKIFQLTKKNPINKQQNQKNDLIDRLRQSQKKLIKDIEWLNECIQKQKNTLNKLQIKCQQLQNNNLALQNQLIRLKEEKRLLEQKNFLHRQAQFTNKIQLKTLIMQKQMIIKQKQLQNQRFNKVIQTISEDKEKLINKISQQHQQYEQVLNKFNLSEYQKDKLKNKDINKQQVKTDEQIRKQESQELQKRIYILQKKIQYQNSQKSAFLVELKRVIKDFQQLDNQNILLRQRLRKSQTQRIRLSSQKSQIEYQLQMIQREKLQKRSRNQQIKLIKSQLKYKSSEETIKIQQQKSFLQQKIQTLERQVQTLRHSLKENLKKYEELQDQHERMRKKQDLAIQILHRKYKAQIQMINNYKDRLITEVNQQRIKCLQIKLYLQKRIQSLHKQYQEQIRSYQKQLSLNSTPVQIQRVRKELEHNMAIIRSKYEQQLKVLLVNLNNLQKQNEFFVYQNSILMNDRIQKFQLAQRVKKIICLKQKVDHLWFIKQVQYANINALLSQMNKGIEKSSIIDNLNS